MQMLWVERAALASLFIVSCLAFAGACLTIGYTYGVDDNVASASRTHPLVIAQTTLPQSPEVPVSPTTPGTLPGTTAGPGTSIGTNPITGQPCLGGGSSAVNGGIPGAPTTQGQPPLPGAQTSGLPPSNSVYGLNNQTSPGAC